MVKTKKGKKEIVTSVGTLSSGDEMETEAQAIMESDQERDNVNLKGIKISHAKKNKKKKGNLDDDNAAEMKSFSSKFKEKNGSKSLEADELSSVTSEENYKTDNKSKKKTSGQKKSAFDLLMDENDVVDDFHGRSNSSNNDETEEIKPVNKTVCKKGKKTKQKKRNDDDGDLDKLLEELKVEYAKQTGSEVNKLENSNGMNEILKEDLITSEDLASETYSKRKKEKKQLQQRTLDEDVINCTEQLEMTEEGGTVKTAAQKKKEKKERQKREAALMKQRGAQLGQTQSKPISETYLEKIDVNVKEVDKVEVSIDSNKDMKDEPKSSVLEEEDVKIDKGKKKHKKEKKAEEEESKKNAKKKGMSAAMVAAMQERLKKIKEEEENQKRLEEERMRQEEERERLRLEAIRLEIERKEKKKQKEAERKARLKAEGKLLTKKQKEDRARAQAMLDALRAQGIEVPDPNERKATRPGTRIRPKKKSAFAKEDSVDVESKNAEDNSIVFDQKSVEKEAVVKESWDATDSEDETQNENENAQLNNDISSEKKVHPEAKWMANNSENQDEIDLSEEEYSENDDSDTGLESSSEEEKDDNLGSNDAETRRLRAESRIAKRQEDAEKKRTTDDLRAAVVCVLGHVDTGKTKILDKLRRTHVQDSEAGGITQQIGATNVPIEAIKEQSKIVRNSIDFEFRLPGLLIIDTPGHESFSNLRNRGSSLCDIAILVVDIMHGLEPQTIESINLLKKKKCPFIVALNKIDRLYDWKLMARRDIRDVLKEQQSNTQLEFNQRTKEIILQFAEQGLNAALFYENPDPKTYVSLVPTSAITGEGMGNLLFLIVEFCQKMLPKRLMFSEELQATVLEVKAIPGLGTTIDTILINGKLREGQTMIVAGTDGPIVTQIRSLLMPQPLKELRVKNAYVEYKEIKAAQGVKIAAKDLEKAIAGINLLIAHKPDEIEICKDEVAKELKSALSHIKVAQIGVYVQASTLGSLEALLEFLRTSKIPYSAIRIGPVVKRDVMKASTMLEHEAQYATILAFDVKIEREAQEMADSLGVKIFQADIIYHLFDKYKAYREELKQKKREKFRSIAVFPCKLKILPQFVFNSRDPIVMGVMVENGIVKVGTPICVPSKEFVDIGIVTSIELNHKAIESARKGQEICVKIEPIPGEPPKMYGRHFDKDDMLVSKISRQSIDACKDYFRDDLIKADWALMVELKKLFEIL